MPIFAIFIFFRSTVKRTRQPIQVSPIPSLSLLLPPDETEIMAEPPSPPLFAVVFLLCLTAAAALTVDTVAFDDVYMPLFGGSNVVRSVDGKGVRILLDRFTGSGFISSDLYLHGFFSADIKLPSNYTAGIVVAFYTSNGDVFEKTHDELDIEFLGNIRGKPWRFQTNVYGNGSTNRGREERYTLWFDPSKEFHRYSILWTSKNIIFYVDDVPVREVIFKKSMEGDYPSKPMSLYATIWDASEWATSGGKYKVNYKYSPFTAEFKDLALQGCAVDPIQQLHTTCDDGDLKLDSTEFSSITPDRRQAMRLFRQKYMYYSHCYDTVRYPVPLPECVIDPSEKRRFRDTGRLKFGGTRRRHSRRRARAQVEAFTEGQSSF